MAACRCDSERALCVRLTAHVAKLHRIRLDVRIRIGEGSQRNAAREVSAHIEQRARWMYHHVGDERGLRRGGRWQHERAALASRRQHHCQCTANRPQLAGKGQLPGELVRIERRLRQLPGRGEDAQRDRKVEAP